MTSRDFAFWLQGYSEIQGQIPTQHQWQIILDHIEEVDEVKLAFPVDIKPAAPPQVMTMTGLIGNYQPYKGYNEVSLC